MSLLIHEHDNIAPEEDIAENSQPLEPAVNKNLPPVLQHARPSAQNRARVQPSRNFFTYIFQSIRSLWRTITCSHPAPRRPAEPLQLHTEANTGAPPAYSNKDLQEAIARFCTQLAVEQNSTIPQKPVWLLQELAKTILKEHPELDQRLRACPDTQAMTAVFAQQRELLGKKLTSALEAQASYQNVTAWAIEKCAADTGYAPNTIEAHVQLDALKTEANKLLLNIIQGKAPLGGQGSAENAFKSLAHNFIANRLALVTEVNALEMPQALKDKWIAAFLQFGTNVKKIPLSAIVAAGKSEAGQILRHALQNNAQGQALAKAFTDAIGVMQSTFNKYLNAEEWADTGAETIEELYSLSAQVMLDATDTLSEALQQHPDLESELSNFLPEDSPAWNILRQANTPQKDNENLATMLTGSRFLQQLQLPLAQGLWSSIDAVRNSFGDVLPNDLNTLRTTQLYEGGPTLMEALGQKVKNLGRALQPEDFKTMALDVFTDYAVRQHLAAALPSYAADHNLPCAAEDVPRALQLLLARKPELLQARSPAAVREILDKAGNDVAAMLKALPALRWAWETNAAQSASWLAKETNLYELDVYTYMINGGVGEHVLFAAYLEAAQNKNMALPPDPRSAEGLAWCTRILQTMLTEKRDALNAINEAPLQASHKIALRKSIFAGNAPKAWLVTEGLKFAATMADNCTTDALEQAVIALQHGNGSNESLKEQMLNMGAQLNMATPESIGTHLLNEEDKAFIRMQACNILLNQKLGTLAEGLARIPSATWRKMHFDAGHLPSAKAADLEEGIMLAHAARGLIAFNLLTPPALTPHATGTATMQEQERLDAAIAYGLPMYEKYRSRVAPEMHNLLRRLIISYGITQQNQQALTPVIERAVQDMASWQDISLTNSPKAICNVIMSKTRQYVYDSMAGTTGATFADNINTNLINDSSRTLYRLNGISVTGDAVMQTLKNLVPGSVAQRFVSTLMHQGTWSEMTMLGTQTSVTDNGQPTHTLPGGEKLATRSLDEYAPMFNSGTHSCLFDLHVEPDNTAILRTTKVFNLQVGTDLNDKLFGECRFVQEFHLNLNGMPQITDYSLAQSFLPL